MSMRSEIPHQLCCKVLRVRYYKVIHAGMKCVTEELPVIGRKSQR